MAYPEELVEIFGNMMQEKRRKSSTLVIKEKGASIRPDTIIFSKYTLHKFALHTRPVEG